MIIDGYFPIWYNISEVPASKRLGALFLWEGENSMGNYMTKFRNSLNPAQIAFAKSYALTNHATNSAIKAGYSSKSAYSQASDLLKIPEIQELVEIEKNNIAARLNVTPERIIREAAKLAFSDVRDYVEWKENNVNLKPSAEIDDIAAAAIQEISSTENGPKIKLHNKQQALKTLTHILGMHTEKNEITGKDGGPVAVNFGVNTPPTKNTAEIVEDTGIESLPAANDFFKDKLEIIEEIDEEQE